MLLEIIIGILIAAACALLARRIYGPKEFAVWRLGLIIAAMAYVVLAVFGQDWGYLGIDLLGVLGYSIFAFLSSRYANWWLAIGWAAHVLWDLLLHPGGHPGFVPEWYPGVCLGFDIMIAVYLLWVGSLQKNASS